MNAYRRISVWVAAGLLAAAGATHLGGASTWSDGFLVAAAIAGGVLIVRDAGVARDAGIDSYRGSLMPQDKAVVVEELAHTPGGVAMVGDAHSRSVSSCGGSQRPQTCPHEPASHQQQPTTGAAPQGAAPPTGQSSNDTSRTAPLSADNAIAA